MRRSRLGLCLCGCVALGSAVGTAGLPAAETNAVPAVRLTDGQLSDMLQGAVLLARMGLYDEAEERCKQILAQQPDQPAVRQLLGEIQQKRREHAASGDLQRRLNETIIPEVSVRDAAVNDVIQFLKEQGQKLSGSNATINLVWEAPEDARTTKVTLNLRKIPLADALRYVTEIAGLRYRVDPQAVVIYKPLPTASKDSPPPNVKP
ncbi:MAG TPA: STN domain-containing protein [Verrucomicrobiae bacterium]|nr:STN domain-containing protein [Verrucomicrobiae bacterium]